MPPSLIVRHGRCGIKSFLGRRGFKQFKYLRNILGITNTLGVTNTLRVTNILSSTLQALISLSLSLIHSL